MLNDNVIIDVDNQYLHFSAAHFTIFSETERERLHGHNYAIRVRAGGKLENNGMAFNYNELKSALFRLCQDLDEYTLLAEHSPYMRVSEQGDYYAAEFNGEKMLLLKSDTLLLPITNVSLEELAGLMLSTIEQSKLLDQLGITSLELEMSSGPGQRVKRLLNLTSSDIQGGYHE
ncbi:6-carboxytetrahydropterin synthase [Paraferrimonas sp. SM1919]|uniref:6-pyruvoyl trahydropterin synthase family protein n=1 Tax=Paraferrimonas sp. SM1919 TaxID=2662263 RepID=UPI0013D628F0|nr:6-carboxytetrahydropterin synthase [Paraferrimonas sp. SM1919]